MNICQNVKRSVRGAHSVFTLLAHGCSVGTDGVFVDDIPWLAHGHMDALWERTESLWTLTWLAHGCSVGTDGVFVDVIAWLAHGCSVRTDGVFVDVNMVGTWML